MESSTEIGQSSQGNMYDQLMALAQNEAIPYLAEALSRGLANLLDIEADEISVDEGLSRFAMDSIMMVRFSTWIQHETSIYLPLMRFTIIRRLQAAQQPLPIHLITAGTAAPNYFANWKQHEAFVRLAAEDNSPEYITSLFQHIEDSQLVAKLVSLMQRDIGLLQSYHYQPEEPLSLGISALAAGQDEMVYRHEIEPWQQHTTADFKLYDVAGDHWFLLRQHEPLEQVVAE